MASIKFKVITHTFPGQHIRYYPGATRNREEDTLMLEAKQYIPVNNQTPQESDITIIGSHAVSYPKECYEPLWEDLLDHCKQRGLRIRSIWIADASNSGASGVLNEHVQGDDPSFFDVALDILQMVNTFRDQMAQPIVGVGHSMGGTALVHLSLIHPRLLSSLVLFDPVIGPSIHFSGIALLYMNSMRPDLWPSREAAEKFFKKVLKTWDGRALDRFVHYGLRATPTLLYQESGKTTLTTTKAQEAWTYARSWFDPLPENGQYATPQARAKYPDMNDGIAKHHPFYRSVDQYVWDNLPRVRPSVLYMIPEGAPLTKDTPLAEKIGRTGTGAGGSGGEKEGRVASVVVRGVGHLLPFERPGECAKLAAIWLHQNIKQWQERRELEKTHRDNKSIGGIALSEEWVQRLHEHYEKEKRLQKRSSKL